MKLMIASDLHGSAHYTELLLKAYAREQADRLLLLGDILYHGPRNPLPEGYNPKEVARMLNDMKQEILCVRGNCDSDVDQMVLEFPIMAEYCLIAAENATIFATHGHVFNEQNLPMLKKGDILLHGHTHVPVCRQHEGYTYVNPGSVSLPKENSEHGYMTVEAGELLWKKLDGTVYSKKAIADLVG